MAIRRRMTASYAGLLGPTRFVTSRILSTGALFAIRALLALYAFTTLFFIFAWNGTHGASETSRQSFSFFTVLTYWGLAFYYAFAAVHTGTFWFTGTPLLARWPKALQVAHSMFYSTIVVYPWLVTIVYWTLLAEPSPTTFALWSNTSQHALNSAYALFEIVVPRTERLPWMDLIPVIILLALYLGLAYLTHATQGFYVYPFLDLQKNSSGKVGAYIVGILVAAVVIFLIVRYMIVLRAWVTEKKLGMTGKSLTRGNATVADEYPLHSTLPK